MTVLLAEDNTMNQQMAKFSIEKCGAKLDIAHHGRHALSACATAWRITCQSTIAS